MDLVGKGEFQWRTISCSFLKTKKSVQHGTGNEKKHTLEKKLQDCEHALERYENEVLKCLEGRSSFSEEMLARLIAKAENELKIARQEYAAAVLAVDNEKEIARKIKECYNHFCGWAEEFEMASLARKRVILSQLFERVEVGRGYEVTVHVNMSYQQFVNMGEPNEKMKITQISATDEEVA